MKKVSHWLLRKFFPSLLYIACFLVLGSLCILPVDAVAQITFERNIGFGTDKNESGYSVIQTSDGSYAVTGVSDRFTEMSDVFLMKANSLGNVLWTKSYGGDSMDYGMSVQQTSDGGYIITGVTESFGSGKEDLYLIKTDVLGETLWTKTFGGMDTDWGESVQQTLDSGYIVTGGTVSFGAGRTDVYLIKTNPAGDILWTKTYGDTLIDVGRSVQQTSDGGYIVAGNGDMRRFLHDWGSNIFLIRTNSGGDTLWTKKFDEIWSPTPRLECSVQETSDQGFIIAGRTDLGFNFEVYLIKTDSLGNALWTRTYGGPRTDIGYSVQLTLEGGYVIAGYTVSFGAGGGDVYLIKTDSLGDTLFTRTYGCSRADAGYSVQETSDGGFIIGGLFNRISFDSSDVYLIKTDVNGLVERDIGTVILDAPGDTVFSDSTYPVAATVQNFGKSYLTFDVIATINGYVDTVQVSCFAPDSTTQVTFNDWQVPSNDSTTYTMTVCTDVAYDVDVTNDCLSKTIYAYTPVGLEEDYSEIQTPPSESRLIQNHPNPFSKLTAISYQLPNSHPASNIPHHVSLKIYDITGMLVKTLVDEKKKIGVFEVEWEGLDDEGAKVPSGIYFYRFQISQTPFNKGSKGDFTQTKKLLLIR
jgi:hypothetical protein